MDFKKYLPQFLIILGFAVIAIVFSLPAYKDMMLSQHDILSWQAMSQEARSFHETTHRTTLWSNSMFGGMPTYTYFIAGGHNYVGDLFDAFIHLLKKPAYFFFLAMLSFFLLMRTMKFDKWLAGFGAVAFAFASYNAVIIVAGHDTKMLSIALMPAVIAGMLLIYEGKYLGGGAIFSLSMAWLFANTHYQIIYYEMIILLGLFIALLVKAIRNGDLKHFAIATAVTGGMALLGFAPSAAAIWTTVGELNKETMRGGQSELKGHDEKKSGGLDKEYAFRWSNGISESFTGLVPYLFGGSVGEPIDKAPELSTLAGGQERAPLYWGDQPFVTGPVYFGAIVCFLFLLGMLVIRNPLKWGFAGAALLGLILSWGRNLPSFNYWFFDHIPFYNAFRTPSMALVILQVIFPIVGIWGISEILQHPEQRAEQLKKLKIAAGIAGGLCLLFAIAGGAFFSYRNPAGDANYPKEIIDALISDRKGLAMKSSFTSAAYILVAAGLVWAFLTGKFKAQTFVIVLGCVMCLDLMLVATDYLNESSYEDADAYAQAFAPRPVDEQIRKDPDPYYRVLDVTRDVYNDALQAYQHKSVGGYSPAKLEIYQDLIERQMNGRFNAQVLNMLNTKYVIFAQGQGTPPVAQPLPTACGHAWFVNEIKWVPDAESEMNALNAPALGDTANPAGSFDPKRTAVIREPFRSSLGNFSPGKDSAAAIQLTSYGLDTMKYTAVNSQAGLAVFSDVYYPHGWHAYVDGKETQIVRANYVLRCIQVPAGKHQVQLVFHPESFYKGDKIALFSSLVLLGLCLTALVAWFRRQSRQEPKQPA